MIMHEPIFQPIKISDFERKVKSIDSGLDFLTITLITADVFLGCIFKYWREPVMAHAFPWDGKTFSLAFNTSEGQLFGFTATVKIPIDQIADISVMPIIGFEKILVQGYPNPLATIFYNHNAQLAELHQFTVQWYGEKAFAQDEIPPEGIYLKQNEPLYVDWTFVQRQMSGAASISGAIIPGILTLNKDGSLSIQDQVFRLIKSPSTSAHKRKSKDLANFVSFRGCIFPVDPQQDDTIEGELWRIYRVAETNGETHAILIKMKELRLPVNFFNRVNSVLTFFGELITLPLALSGQKYDKALLTRVIAYIDQP